MRFKITEADVLSTGKKASCPLEYVIEKELRLNHATISVVRVNLLTAHVVTNNGIDTHLDLPYSLKQALTDWSLDRNPPLGEWDLDNDEGNFDTLIAA